MSPPREWLDRFASTTQLQLERFDSRQLCTVLWSLNHHGYRPRAPWVQAFLRASQPLLGTMSDSQLVGTLVHLNRMRAMPSGQWVVELVAAARSRSFDARQERLMERAVAALISRMRHDSGDGDVAGEEAAEAEVQGEVEGGVFFHDSAPDSNGSSDKITANATQASL